MEPVQSLVESNQEEFVIARFRAQALSGQPTAVIAEKLGLPKDVVHKILVRLRRAGQMSYANGWYFNG